MRKRHLHKSRVLTKEKYFSACGFYFTKKQSRRAVAKRLNVSQGTLSAVFTGRIYSDWFEEFQGAK